MIRRIYVSIAALLAVVLLAPVAQAQDQDPGAPPESMESVIESADVEPTVNLTLIKEVAGDGTWQQEFEWEIDANFVGFVPDGGQLTQPVSAGAAVVFGEIQYDFTLQAINCDTATVSNLDPIIGTATITLGQLDATCTVVSDPPPPVTVTIEKSAPDSDGRTFDFEIDGQVVSLGDGDTHEFSAPGFQEMDLHLAPVAGFRVVDFQCSDAGSSGWGSAFGGGTTFHVTPYELAVDCTVSSVRTGSVELSMTAVIESGAGNETVQIGPFLYADGETKTIVTVPGEVESFYVPPSYLHLVDFSCNDAASVAQDDFLEVYVGETSADCVATFSPSEFSSDRLGIVVETSVETTDEFTVDIFIEGYLYRSHVSRAGELREHWVPRGVEATVTTSAPPGWQFDGVICTGEDPVNVSADGPSQSFELAEILGDQVCTVNAAATGTVTVKVRSGVGEETSAEVNDGSTTSVDHLLPPGSVPSEVSCQDTAGDPVAAGWSSPGPGDFQVSLQVGNLDVDCDLALSPAPTVDITITKQAGGADPELAFMLEIGDDTYDLVDGQSVTVPWHPYGSLEIREPYVDGWLGTQLWCIGDPEFPEEYANAWDYFENGEAAGRSFELWFVGDVDLDCTLVNEQLGGSGLVELTVAKEVSGDDPTDGATEFVFVGPFGEFTLKAGESATWQVSPSNWISFYELLHERPGWSAEVPTCTVNGQPLTEPNFYAYADPWVADIQLLAPEAGDPVVCTFVNRAVEPASLTLTKQLQGGSTDEAFTIVTPAGTHELTVGEPLELQVAPGAHGLFETGVAGWELTGFDCTGATDFVLDVGGRMDVEIPEGGTVDCTITNSAVGQVQVNVTKEVVGDSDPNAVFTLLSEPYTERRIADGDTVSFTVSAGTIVIGETMPTGWRLDDAACTGQASQANYLGLGYVELTAQAGATIDCVFRNRQQPHATMLLTKQIDGVDPNPNGTLFEFRHGTDVITLGAGDIEEFPIGASGSVLEDVRPGWEVESIVCGDVAGAVITSYERRIEFDTVPQDGQLECTVTNRPVGIASLTITNTIDGSDDFFSRATSFFGPYGSFSIADGDTSTLTLSPGPVSISHWVREGWEMTVDCGPDEVALFTGAFGVTLDPDDVVVCEVVNSPAATASLTIVKETVGDGAIPDFANFNFFAAAERVNLVNGESAILDIPTGQVVVTESLSYGTGWTIEEVECVDGTGTVVGSTYFDFDTIRADVVLDVVPEDVITCTFRNRYEEPDRPAGTSDPGVTTIVKDVVNAGDADYADELFFYEWYAGTDNGFLVLEPDGVGRPLITSYSHGTLTIIEQPQPGWDLVSVTCTGTPWWNRNGTRVDLAMGPGIDPVCTFINEPVDLSTVTLVVETSGGGTPASFEFNTANGPVNGAEGAPVTLDVGTTFWAEQQALAGWNLASVVCDGAEQTDYVFGTDASLNRIEPGSFVTCTWRNESAATALVSVTQQVDGDAGTDEFPVFTPLGEFALSAGETVDIELPVGNSYVATSPKAGYQIENLTCDGLDWSRGGNGISLHLTAGDEISCVFESRVEAPVVVTIQKTIEGFDNGQTFTFWTPVGEILVRGGESVDVAMPAGTLNIERRSTGGWQHRGQVCDRAVGVFMEQYFDSGFANLSLAPGETATCEFVSRLWFQPELGTVRVEKVVDGADDGTSFLFAAPYGTDAALAGGESFEVEVEVGRPHDFTELAAAGWNLDSAECVGAVSSSRAGAVLSVEVAQGATAVCTFTNSPDAAPPSFMDVPAGAYFEGAVGWAGDADITAGTSDTTFSPHAQLTRAQMATFLWRYAGEPTDVPVHGFSDVPAGAYYDIAVAWLKREGITAGTSATMFSPNAPVTRAQMAAFLWRMENEPAGAGHSFVDVPAGAYFDVAVGWMADLEITTGTSATTFSPHASLTRAQAVTFLWRLAGQP